MSKVARLKHANAREAVLSRIRSGYYRPGQRLPSERELATDLELSHITVRRGLEDLVEAGVIVKKPRVGNFVQQVRSMELAHRVAIVLPKYMHDSNRTHPIPTLMMQGVMGELDQRDCSLSLVSYHYAQFWLDAGEAMLARGVTGALVWADADTPVEQMEKLKASGIKVVLLNGGGLWPHLRLSNVSIDLEGPMREALQRIGELGHKRVKWVSYTETRYRDLERSLMMEYGRKFGFEKPEQGVVSLPDAPFDYSTLADLLKGSGRPTAIIAVDEFISHEIFRLCHKYELNVPRDLSLVAIADSLPQSHVVPLSAPNTSALWIDAARRAAHHLRHLLANDDDKQIEVLLHSPIQWKESTARPRTASV